MMMSKSLRGLPVVPPSRGGQRVPALPVLEGGAQIASGGYLWTLQRALGEFVLEQLGLAWRIESSGTTSDCKHRSASDERSR